MAQPSQKVDELQLVDMKDQVIQFALQGQQPSKIAKALGISRSSVSNMLDEVLADSSEHLMASAERLFLLNLLRLERLQEAISPFAFGEYTPPAKEGEPAPEKWLPDRNMGALMKDIVKLELDAVLRLYELRAKLPEEGSQRIVRTLVAHDDMYDIAQVNMEADWLDTYADMDADDLLPDAKPQEIDEIAVLDTVKTVEKRVDKLQQTFKTEQEEEDE